MAGILNALRDAAAAATLTLVLAAGLATSAIAGDQTIKIGLNFSFTGADADGAERVKGGILMAIDDANLKPPPGYRFEPLILDDGSATSGHSDPAQAAINARKMVSDPTVLAAVGPQMSSSGKAMSPILSQADLAIITPIATNPDITSPEFTAQYRPKGKAIFFRTVATDAFQGPNMANYYFNELKVKSVYLLDDSNAYGVGLVDAFQKQAEAIGLKVLGRDQLNPTAPDYTSVMTKIAQLKPESIYYGGDAGALVKVVKQSYEILPDIVKGGGDGVYSPELFTGAGFPAAEGWYATIAAPNLLEDAAAQEFIADHNKKYGRQPDNYTITAYDATLVIVDAIRRVIESGQELTRENVRAAIHATELKTLQGVISFDENGDLKQRVISVFQAKRDDAFPLDDVGHQFKYVGAAL